MVGRLGAILLANVVFLGICLCFVEPSMTAHQTEKRTAIHLAIQAQEVLGAQLTGPEYTFITTTLAPPAAKRLSLQPDFAAVFVEWLTEAGVGPGKRVAVNFSGSFPALNIAVLSAIQALGAEPVIVSSIGASTWGATDPDFTWLDMEKKLLDAGLWKWRSAGASLGGVWDRGGGMPPEGKAMALAAIRRNGASLIDPVDLRDAIARRLSIYRNGGELPGVLVNVGGNHVIFGEAGHRSPLPEGLNIGYHPLLSTHDGLAAVFLQSNRPVIHVINIAQIAARYGIHKDVPPGESGAFALKQLPVLFRVAVLFWVGAMLLLLWRGRPNIV